VSAHYAALSTGIGQGIIDWNDTSALAGIMLFDKTKRTIETHDSSTYFREANTSIARIQNEYHELTDNINTVRKAAEDSIIALQQEVDAISKHNIDNQEALSSRWTEIREESDRLFHIIHSDSENLKTLVNTSTEYANRTVDNWLSAQMEQRQIAEPARLWNERSKTHLRNAKRLKWIAIGTASVGLPICGMLITNVFSITGDLMKNGLTEISVTPDKTDLLTVFHYQVLATATATIIVLTMYLWMIRIIVRVYTTEHHLAIDAGARGAMNQTYLGLIAAGAANEQDRQIVLAALFRPVQDGIVKDDGMPLTGPSAALASLVRHNK
jgi:hypothetical protein